MPQLLGSPHAATHSLPPPLLHLLENSRVLISDLVLDTDLEGILIPVLMWTDAFDSMVCRARNGLVRKSGTDSNPVGRLLV